MSQDKKEPQMKIQIVAEALREETGTELEEFPDLDQQNKDLRTRCRILKLQLYLKQDRLDEITSRVEKKIDYVKTLPGGMDFIEYLELMMAISPLYNKCTEALGEPRETEDPFLQLDMVLDCCRISREVILKGVKEVDEDYEEKEGDNTSTVTF